MGRRCVDVRPHVWSRVLYRTVVYCFYIHTVYFYMSVDCGQREQGRSPQVESRRAAGVVLVLRACVHACAVVCSAVFVSEPRPARETRTRAPCRAVQHQQQPATGQRLARTLWTVPRCAAPAPLFLDPASRAGSVTLCLGPASSDTDSALPPISARLLHRSQTHSLPPPRTHARTHALCGAGVLCGSRVGRLLVVTRSNRSTRCLPRYVHSRRAEQDVAELAHQQTTATTAVTTTTTTTTTTTARP